MEIHKRLASGRVSKIPMAEGEPSIYMRYNHSAGHYEVVLEIHNNAKGEAIRVHGTVREWEAATFKIGTQFAVIHEELAKRAKVRGRP